MGLLAKLGLFKDKDKSAFRGLKAELSDLKKDGRLYRRVKISDPTLAGLTLADTPTLGIVDLSYGGISAFMPPNFTVSPGSTPSGRLHILNRFIDINLTVLRATPCAEAPRNQSLAAFKFLHVDTDTLLFLRQFIEPSLLGDSLTYIAHSLRQARYNHLDWHCFRGEGPVDLLLRCERNSGTPVEFLMTFRIQENYWELSYSDGRLSTGQAIDSNKSALEHGVARVIPSVEPDPHVLRTAIFILSSCSATHKDLADPIIRLAKVALNSSTKPS